MGKHIVLFVTIDCLRFDYIDELNKIIPRNMPRIQYRNFYASGPYTWASFPSIFTGTYPFMFNYRFGRKLKPRITMAQLFKELGYRTFGITGNNVFLSRYYGYSIGFDKYIDYMDIGSSDRKVLSKALVFLRKFLLKKKGVLSITNRLAGVFEELLFTLVLKKVPEEYTINCKRETNNLLDIIEEVVSKGYDKVFIWIHYMDLHPPYNELVRYMLSKDMLFIRAMEFGLISCNRKYLSLAKEAYLRSLKILFKTLRDALSGIIDSVTSKDYSIDIVLTSDHGEEFGEHGGFGHQGIIGMNYNIYHLYNELLKIPLIIASNRIDTSRSDYRLFSHIDLLPTILSLTNRGHSILKILPGRNILDTSTNEHSMVVSESEALKICDETYGLAYSIITSNGYKYILHPIYGIEIYNINDDPLEEKVIKDKDLLMKARNLLVYHHRNKLSLMIKYKMFLSKHV